jgi:hypothetical protein
MCSIVLMTTPLGDPGAVLKIRELSCDFSMFLFVSMRDIAGIKSLLRKRVAHPSATFWGGWTPLYVGQLVSFFSFQQLMHGSTPSQMVMLQYVDCYHLLKQTRSLRKAAINCESIQRNPELNARSL